MEVPVISRINPSFFISRLIDLTKSSSNSPQRSSLKWAALIIIFLLFTFTNIASRLKLLLFHPFSPSKTLSDNLHSINLYDDDVSSSDDNDTYTSEDDGEEEDEDEDDDEFEKDFRKKGDYDFGYNEGQRGSFSRSRPGSFGESISSLTELLTGNVVKFWDDFDYGCGYDSDCDHFPGGFAAVASPAGVVVSADTGDYNKLGVNLWDARVRRRRPAVHAEWSRRRPATAKLGVGVGGGKIYVSDDVEGKRLVGDMRKVDSPLTDLAAFDDVGDDDHWWDADVE